MTYINLLLHLMSEIVNYHESLSLRSLRSFAAKKDNVVY